MLESFLVLRCKLRPSLMLRLVARSIYVCEYFYLYVLYLDQISSFFNFYSVFFISISSAMISYLYCIMWYYY